MANLGPNLSQRLSQSQTLALTPAMQLKLKLWQMNLLELSQTIERELGRTRSWSSRRTGTKCPPWRPWRRATIRRWWRPPLRRGRRLPEGTDSVDLGPLPEAAGDLDPEASREEGISQVQETEIGAENSWDTDIPRTSNLPEDERTSWEDRLSSTETLQEHLLVQLYQTLDPDDPRAPLLEALIDHVDAKGFLRVDPDQGAESTPLELAMELAIDEAQLRELLDIIQEFDPSGVGCFTVQESLLLQLRHAGAEPDDLAVRIIQDHCDLLSQRDTIKLRKAIGCSEEDLGEALAILRHLHPAPGRAFDPESERVVKPGRGGAQGRRRHLEGLPQRRDRPPPAGEWRVPGISWPRPKPRATRISSGRNTAPPGISSAAWRTATARCCGCRPPSSTCRSSS